MSFPEAGENMRVSFHASLAGARYWTRKAREDGVSGPTLGVGRPPAEGSRGGTGRNRRNRDDRWPRPARAYYKLEELDRRREKGSNLVEKMFPSAENLVEEE